MSNAALTYVHHLPDVGDRALLLVLAERMDSTGQARVTIRELRDALGISQQWLSEQLKRLEQAGLIQRTVKRRGYAVAQMQITFPQMPRQLDLDGASANDPEAHRLTAWSLWQDESPEGQRCRTCRSERRSPPHA
jgi:biotin operon repressor